MDKNLETLERIFINVISIHLYTCIIMAYIYFRADMSLSFIITNSLLGVFPLLANITNIF